MDKNILSLVIFAVFAVVMIVVIFGSSRRTTAIREVLQRLASSAGWMNLRKISFIASGVKGTWRSFPVDLAYHPRQKSVPQRFILRVRAQTDARLTIKRRYDGLFSNKPITWFGPPLIETQNPEFWVRGDEATLAARVFSDSKLVTLISENLVARFDEIKVDRKGLRITRAIDEKPVKDKYGLSFLFDPVKTEPIAQQEIALAEAMVDKLSMLA